MYAGHAALATLAKGRRPRIPIALLVPIAFAPDWIEWIADALGHHNRMISHSLVSVAIGATTVGVLYWIFTHSAADAFGVWLTYASHWPADFITGIKPTWPGGPMVGLMLYDHPMGDVVVESVLIVLCWLYYRRSLPIEARPRAIAWLIPFGLIGMQLAFGAISDPSFR
ncbi:MAG TPA: hypothetical protein VN706_11510 [Gemmatimonadaceae bacterium]|nr:hypothetical protein [Gemmatimonadaceae bacterium]